MSNANATTVSSLEAKRDELRAKAAKDPRVAKLEALRVHRVTYKQRLLRADLTDEEKGNLTSALHENQQLADQLLGEVHADVVQVQGALSAARKVAKAEQTAADAAKLEGLTDEQLEQRRAALSGERRKLKRELRAVVRALSAREASAAVKALVSSKSELERKALFDELSAEFKSAE